MEVNPNFSPRAQEDLDLVKSALDGDQRAYANLMNRYKDSIFFLVLKMVRNEDDANDLTIEAFGKAFSNLAKYTPDFAFSTWLYKIALNNCIDFIRKKKIETLSLFDTDEDDKGEVQQFHFHSTAPDPEEQYIKMQRNKILRDIIDKINPKYRLLIQLRYYEELSYEEIAEKTSLPLGTVKAQLFRAKNLLFEIISPKKERM
ncbi:MAG: sigma-70 family RNA polymerase sigma factor [Chitinophagales bacterium]|nr:sigma-70 family RNA polymerase sigma factor [Chitinophagales bacterium]